MLKTNYPFTIRFSEKLYAPTVRVDPNTDPQFIIDGLELRHPRPTIFLTGGASLMTKEHISSTQKLISDGIARFAEAYNITVVDGGTNAGVMQMIGKVRRIRGYKFPLIGCAPYYKVSYPGAEPTQTAEAMLDAGHSHFVLVNSQQWGGESQTIVNLVRAIAARQKPMLGVLINGGSISLREVFYASVLGVDRIPILVLAGSGRAADRIAMTVMTRQSKNKIIRGIVQRGDIRLFPLSMGVLLLLRHLRKHFTGR